MIDHSFVVSGFADEIGPCLEEQLTVLNSLGIDHLDLRSVEETNVVDLSDEQVGCVERTLDEHGISITSIGSPIGKITVTDDFGPHLDRFERAIEMAETFDAEYIRVFSYYIPEGEDPADHRGEVLRRMKAKVELAEATGVTLLHENEKDIYGDTPARCRDLLTTIDSPNFRAVFDPANFLEIGISPYPEVLLDIVEYVDQLHIKDAMLGERGAMTLAGEGDAGIPEILSAFKRRGFTGPVSLEPHLAYAGPKSGYSGPKGYELAVEALVECFQQVDANYE